MIGADRRAQVMAVACPHCAARVGRPCVDPGGQDWEEIFHVTRRKAAGAYVAPVVVEISPWEVGSGMGRI